ncbi:ABC transporter permease [Paenibacillus sp. GCM10027626]|uniref:ABC transporter permease n=1 Tax=Paenibacillus sp. GCM10027626 TaxID=3273411 RepID=UPI0036317DFD
MPGKLSLKKRKGITRVFQDYQLYLLIVPAFAFVFIFQYIPMYGVQIAFKDYNVLDGFWESGWVGLDHFVRFFESPNFATLIGNTLGLSLYQSVVGFPVPIIFAIMIHEVANKKFKSAVQMVAYAPHFISTVVIVSMLVLFLHSDRGLINNLIAALGGPRVDFISRPEWFKTVYVFSGVWQNAGWGTIIYLAALSSVDPQLTEASRIDGANRLQKIWHVDLPGIAPTIIILLILDMGSLLSVGFEKVLLMQNPLNMSSADVIQTYVYRIGIVGGQFSYSAAIGLFNALVNFIMLVIVNQIARRRSETSLW